MKMVKLPGKNYARLFLSLSLIALLGLTACNEDPTGSFNDNVHALASDELILLEDEESVESSFEEVDEIAFEALEMTDASLEARMFSNPAQLRSSCAVVTHDSVNKIITVDFGTGCLGGDGKTRSGRIHIAYTYRLYRPGASVSLTFDNFTVDSLGIEGVRTLTNVSQGANAPLSLRTTLTGGKVTWPDSSFATREFTRTRTWLRGAQPGQDEFHVEGVVRGMNRAGSSYRARIVATLIFKRACRRQGINIPVKGIKVIERDNQPTLMLDFGDGQCDHLITVTKNGSSRVVDVSNW